jgi:hypothetical protein
MSKKISDHNNGRGNTQGGKEQSPGPGADFRFSPSAQGGPTAVNDSEDQEQQQHHQAGVMHSAA